MGKLTDSLLTAYLEKTQNDKDKYYVRVCLASIKQLAKDLPEGISSQIDKACDDIYSNCCEIEKKAFNEGLHMMLDRI